MGHIEARPGRLDPSGALALEAERDRRGGVALGVGSDEGRRAAERAATSDAITTSMAMTVASSFMPSMVPCAMASMLLPS